MAAAESTARTVALHPLAIVGVSDHFTRVSVGGSRQGAGSPVVGLLFGMQRGLEVDVVDAIEVHLTEATKVDERQRPKQPRRPSEHTAGHRSGQRHRQRTTQQSSGAFADSKGGSQ